MECIADRTNTMSVQYEWSRKAFYASLVLAMALFVAGADRHAIAQKSWKPEKTVELIVGTPPASPNDVVARAIQKIVQDRKLVEVPVVVVNKPGGGLSISWSYLNQHPGNGHYLAMSALNLLSNHITGASPLRHTDVVPVAQLFSEYIVFSVRADSALQTGKDVIARIKKDPGALSIGVSPGAGGANHAAMAMVMTAAGVDSRKAKFVFFNAAVDSSTAVLGGHLDFCATTSSSVIGHMKNGKLRIIAVAAPQRLLGDLAHVPTWKEQGVDVSVDTFRGIIAPKGTPREQLAYWEDVFARLTQTEEWKAEVTKRLWTDNYMNSAESRKYLEAQYAAQQAILGQLGLAKQ